MADEELICLGTVVKPHGIRGEVVAELLLEDPGFLVDVHTLFLLSPSQGRQKQHDMLARTPEVIQVRSLREHKGRLLLHLQGIDTRDAAETLRGYSIWAPEQALPELDADAVYCHQLVGCRVFLENGDFLGVVREVLTPSEEQEIWSIETPQGAEVLFPAHPETVIDIDIDAQQVRIAPPEGLLEIYLRG